VRERAYSWPMTKPLFLLGLSLYCFWGCLGEQAAIAQVAPQQDDSLQEDATGRWKRGVANRGRVIVQTEAQKLGTRAVEFGMWVHTREILTMALGNSMTIVPATTRMHYRIGGIAETFMSTLLLMLVEQGRICLNDKISRWFPDLLAADQVTVRMLYCFSGAWIGQLNWCESAAVDCHRFIGRWGRAQQDTADRQFERGPGSLSRIGRQQSGDLERASPTAAIKLKGLQPEPMLSGNSPSTLRKQML
jgi:CubicO group peptidase (beta-lactamase class C family)